MMDLILENFENLQKEIFTFYIVVATFYSPSFSNKFSEISEVCENIQDANPFCSKLQVSQDLDRVLGFEC